MANPSAEASGQTAEIADASTRNTHGPKTSNKIYSSTPHTFIHSVVHLTACWSLRTRSKRRERTSHAPLGTVRGYSPPSLPSPSFTPLAPAPLRPDRRGHVHAQPPLLSSLSFSLVQVPQQRGSVVAPIRLVSTGTERDEKGSWWTW